MAEKLMNNTFEFVGKISPCKETDSFKPYSTVRFNNSCRRNHGYMARSFRFRGYAL